MNSPETGRRCDARLSSGIAAGAFDHAFGRAVLEKLEILLRSDGSRCGVSDSGRYLARELRAEIAGGKQAANTRLHVLVGDDVTHVVMRHMVHNDSRVRPESDEDEHA